MGEPIVNLFGGTIEILSRSLDYRSRNHEIILNNVANADTPHYRPFALDVETALQQSNPQKLSTIMTTTDGKHLPGSTVQPGGPVVEERSKQEDPLLFRGDQNGVNIDKEMTELAKNSLLYKASSQFVAAKFKGLKYVLTGGNK